MEGKISKSFLITLFFSFGLFFSSLAQKVYVFELKEEIGPSAWKTVKQAFDSAQNNKSDYILMELNTYGGALNFADSIRTKLLDSNIKSIVYINNNAASAGALISLASDYIYVHPGSSIGAASVVNAEGEVLPEKYQSYMRGLMRTTAEARKRDPQLAEAFVDPNISIPSIKKDGQLVTLTSGEAVKFGLAKAEVANREAIYKDLNLVNVQETIYRKGAIDHIISFLINPAVSGILILLIIGGIYAEMQAPGLGFAIAVAIIAALLFFAPLYIQGLAANWEIAIFVVGLILIILEVFVIPGFGIVGILGIIFVICGLTFSLVANDFLDFKLAYPGMLFNSFLLVMGAMILSVILMVIFGKSLLKTPVFRRLVLQDEQKSEEGYTSSILKSNLLNKEGVARTVLRPSGKIEIEGVWYDAVALDGFIEEGEEVYVDKHENYNLFVRRKSEKG
ncbi:nodulation protein NfeD [Sphingobacterium sp. SRCM116780]|uniref:NfeD family protein n=1 Tax=Sphingobacterium sp. SRCM116780 TaxID=2907623 RepID=UPI001F30DC68|nr:NfeD family protein [Sphingobacterium sp. SRCM116780]UIR57162.1 nodulation protein NfeD [Sphingobacterium sp. SRCM116780]